MQALKTSADVLFILLGAVMVLAMHAGFAFLELGTVRRKNQVNALMKILVDFSVSTIAYFFIGYAVAYGVTFFTGAEALAAKSGYELVRFFFLLTFAAAVPAIVSGGVAERAKFNPHVAATFVLVGFLYPFFEGIAWNGHFGIQQWLGGHLGAEFHDFAGSVVVHAMGGWIALPAVLLLGARRGRYTKDGHVVAFPPSNIPFLALGAWVLSVGWFGFNVMSAQTLDRITGLVAVNSLMAMAGGTIAGLLAGRIGGRPILFTGMALQAVALGWLALVITPTIPYDQMVVPFILAGIGMGLFFAPIANVVLSAVRREEEGKASGATNTIREVGGVFGVAVLAAIFTANGDYGSPAAYVAGLQPAVAVGAIVVGIGAVAALFIPAGAGARASVAQPTESPVEALSPVAEPV